LSRTAAASPQERPPGRDAALGREGPHVAVRPERLRRVGDPIADAEACDAFAHRFDDARGFHAENERHRHRSQRRVVAAPAVHVGEIDADGGLPDAYLARTRRCVRDHARQQDFRTAETVDCDLASHLSPHA
jgi:hypothetical protein